MTSPAVPVPRTQPPGGASSLPGWERPLAVVAHPDDESFGLGAVLPVDRTRQRTAVAAHPSQAVPGSVLWRRLDLLGDREHLRWLRPRRRPAPTTS